MRTKIYPLVVALSLLALAAAAAACAPATAAVTPSNDTVNPAAPTAVSNTDTNSAAPAPSSSSSDSGTASTLACSAGASSASLTPSLTEGPYYKEGSPEPSTAARERALSLARSLTRHSANAIRAIHRGENDLAEEHLREGRQIAESLQTSLINYLDIYYAGYTQDALKEFAEANLTYALITNGALPTPEYLAILPATYLQGLAEAAGELRRNCLDALLRGDYPEAERMLNHMDEIYSVLVTMDYPDAITGGLRRLTDVVRGVTERTRGDLTLSLRQQSLEQSLQRLERKLEGPRRGRRWR